jgi:hypothetical protein
MRIKSASTSIARIEWTMIRSRENIWINWRRENILINEIGSGRRH